MLVEGRRHLGRQRGLVSPQIACCLRKRNIKRDEFLFSFCSLFVTKSLRVCQIYGEVIDYVHYKTTVTNVNTVGF